MSKRKDPNKPKGPTSAYAYFVQAVRKELKKNPLHPPYIDFPGQCAAAWVSLLPEQKGFFLDLAEKDKVRYEDEMKVHEAKTGAKKKKVKDPRQPKRSVPAFVWFCNEERPKVKAKYPEYSFGEVSKEMGRLWGKLDAERRQVYQTKAVEDQNRYKREMYVWQHKSSSDPEEKDDEPVEPSQEINPDK